MRMRGGHGCARSCARGCVDGGLGLGPGLRWSPAMGEGVSCWVVVVLAQAGRPESPEALQRVISENWGGDAMAPLRWIVVAAGLLMLALGAVLLWRWWRTRHLRSQPLVVFNQVAQAAGLGVSERWLLLRIARQQALPTPLTLLLSGRTLRVHGRGYVQAQPPWRRAMKMQRIASIRRRLFGKLGGEEEG